MRRLIDLTGQWRIQRRIFGQNARFSGQATIDAQGRYHESGQLQQGAQSFEAYRNYIYERQGDELRILFPDGRVFLNLKFKDGIARDTHVCGDDVYEALFKLRQNGWVSAYKVRGPRKDYTVVSVIK